MSNYRVLVFYKIGISFKVIDNIFPKRPLAYFVNFDWLFLLKSKDFPAFAVQNMWTI